MSRPPWFPLHVADYDNATAELTLEQDGLYSRMLRRAWSSSDDGASLPADTVKLCRVLGIARLPKGGAEVIDRFWKRVGDRIVNRRLLAEADRAHERSRKAGESGRRSADARRKIRTLAESTNVGTNVGAIVPTIVGTNVQRRHQREANYSQVQESTPLPPSTPELTPATRAGEAPAQCQDAPTAPDHPGGREGVAAGTTPNGNGPAVPVSAAERARHALEYELARARRAVS